jgi:membrane protein
MFNKQNIEKFITNLAYTAFIFSISCFPTLLFTKYLRKNQAIFNTNTNSTTQLTSFESILLLTSISVLFVFLPIILIKVTEYKKKNIYGIIALILALVLYVLGSLTQNNGVIDNYIAFCIYGIFFIIVWILVKSIIAIYAWLWEETTEENGKNKRELDIKKVALLWTILTTIIGVLFGFKK